MISTLVWIKAGALEGRHAGAHAHPRGECRAGVLTGVALAAGGKGLGCIRQDIPQKVKFKLQR